MELREENYTCEDESSIAAVDTSKLAIQPIEVSQIPEILLLDADPSIERIAEYLLASECIGASLDDAVVGICVIDTLNAATAELMNIAVDPAWQWRGIGTALMRYLINVLTGRGYRRITVGTGCFGHQLIFYQKLGFRAQYVAQDFFTDNYHEPIIEHGIRHRDMLRLELKL